ncbi:cochlin-like [Rhopilema esculentum]|uniref:cochlin-like n=1 Tax=Rhopilema esculentum TaxID=499914 RepID=UPI0031DCA9DD
MHWERSSVTMKLILVMATCAVAAHLAVCCEKECRVDLGFLLDGSGSIGKSGLAQEVQFVERISSMLGISKDQSHVSVILFESHARMVLSFRYGTSQNALSLYLNRIRYRGGGTNTEHALRLAASRMFNRRYGARSGVRKVLVVFTDGKSSSGLQRVVAAAAILKRMGITVISIGVGSRVSRHELHAISTAPAQHHVFTVNSPLFLKNIEKKVKSELCTTCPQPASSKVCNLDIGFVLDESGSIGSRGFNDELRFVKSISKELSVSSKGSHVSVMTFGTYARMRIRFKDAGAESQQMLEKHINSIRYRGGGTNTEAALNLAQSQMFHSSFGARRGIAKVLIVFTDGRSKSGVTRVRAAAEKLKDAGVNMISVGVGRRISTAELHAMASQPTSKHVFRVPTPSLLSSIVSRVKTVSCSAFTCQYAECKYGQWSEWSKSCGLAIRRRNVLQSVIKTKVAVGGCAGVSTKCHLVQESKDQGSCLVNCSYVECQVGAWSAWSKPCGDGHRRRDVKVIRKTELRSNCNGLKTSCDSIGVYSRRSTNCSCEAVECDLSQWSQWSATCGHATRYISFVPRKVKIEQKSCDGLQTKCPEEREVVSREEPSCVKTGEIFSNSLKNFHLFSYEYVV